jgi:hypothetical protein
VSARLAHDSPSDEARQAGSGRDAEVAVGARLFLEAFEHIMLRFTGRRHSEPIVVNIAYRAVYDKKLTLALADAIGILAQAIGIARGQDISGEQEALRWMKELLIGFALLAVAEARSIILLLGDGLSRHARVHVRSLFELRA